MTNFEIGEWVYTSEDSIGQVLYVRDLYLEEFTGSTQNTADFTPDVLTRKNPYSRWLVVKNLCSFEGKIRRGHKISFVPSKYCHALNSQFKSYVKAIKKDQAHAYERYVKYDHTNDRSHTVSLIYECPENEIDTVLANIEDIDGRLWPSFTFKEFKKEFKKDDVSVNLKNYLKMGSTSFKNPKQKIIIHLQSRLMKVINKEMVFYYAQAHRLSDFMQ